MFCPRATSGSLTYPGDHTGTWAHLVQIIVEGLKRKEVSESQRLLIMGRGAGVGPELQGQEPAPEAWPARSHGHPGEKELNAWVMGKSVLGLALFPCVSQAHCLASLSLPFFLWKMGSNHCNGQYRLGRLGSDVSRL